MPDDALNKLIQSRIDELSAERCPVPEWFRTDVAEALYPALTPSELGEATDALWAQLGPRFGES